MTTSSLRTVLAAIDAINQRDPHQKELPYAEHLTSWVLKLNPAASEELQIAARGQHIARWSIPRESYPMDRGGYLRWREELKKFHAQQVGDLMKKNAYGDETINRVKAIILKKDIKGNADTQTLEDGLCLVFLEAQFSDLRQKTPADKMGEIVRKTWKKMSTQGQQAALTLHFSDDEKAFLLSALNNKPS